VDEVSQQIQEAVRYRIVDVFTDRPLAGNGLCVILDPCPTDLQQAVAREVNLSETTFPTRTGPEAYTVRILTPQTELPFAGHPSIGTAWVLGPGTWTQSSPGATVTVTADSDGARLVQPVPSIEDHPPAAAIAALGLPSAAGCWAAEAGGTHHLIVATEAPIDELAPDLAAVRAASAAAGGATTLAVVRRRDDANLHVRVFAPASGIPEDPGTGSAAGPVGVVARRLWGLGPSLTISQGAEIGRPCHIEVDLTQDTPVVGGRVAACAEGRFTL
jgi:trans-2,3-dihydro-3-hydroxyanthranilate isomerase